MPGGVEIGDRELVLEAADGHTDDGMAVWIPWARVLVAGDYLSPVEIPMIEGSARAYLATLARLEPLVEQADYVVPGHGEPLDGVRAAAILREDRAYIEALLEQGEAAKLPLARRTAEQRKIHARNVARVGRRDPSGVSLHERDEALEAAIFDAARRRLAEPPALGSTLDGLPAPAVTRGGSRRRARRRAAARRASCRPPSRSTTSATSRSSRRLRRPRPRSPTCCSPSTPSTAARGSRPPARCTPRTRRWRGWRPSRASPTPPAAASSRAARTGTCPRSTPPASGRATAVGRPPTSRATRRCTRPCARWPGSWTPRCWPCPASGSPARRWPTRCTQASFAVVATAGTTNLGTIDDLAGVAAVCAEHDTWLHVDGAYGLAALCAPSARPRFAGLERADSFIVDPHKWLFSPFDCCALVYRDPAVGRAAHRQHAAYLESLYADDDAFNPSDYGLHLTRRARGLPLWFALAVHGTDAFEHAVERSLDTAREAAAEIRSRPELELLAEPELTILAFRRRGWTAADYDRWAEELRTSGTAFVTPTTVAGETVARLAIVNPRTTLDDVRVVLDAAR